jgi:hypothetical protein
MRGLWRCNSELQPECDELRFFHAQMQKASDEPQQNFDASLCDSGRVQCTARRANQSTRGVTATSLRSPRALRLCVEQVLQGKKIQGKSGTAQRIH